MKKVKVIDPKEVSARELHGYLLGTIAPRPIAFASTVDSAGNVNLSPFSYFNVFGTNPPILIFSPSRRVRGNTNKHTLENVHEVKEVVINIVNFTLVEQMSLASTEYDKGINEFIKAGLTPVGSQKVTPPRVKECPAAFECIVTDIIETGKGAGAGNLILCEVVLAYVDESILDVNDNVDPQKLDAVARMGGDWYCRAHGEALFQLAKPGRYKGIGIDQLPEFIKASKVLTGNNLARLAGVKELPSPKEVEEFKKNPKIHQITQIGNNYEKREMLFHTLAQDFLKEDDVEKAWLTLLQLFTPPK